MRLLHKRITHPRIVIFFINTIRPEFAGKRFYFHPTDWTVSLDWTKVSYEIMLIKLIYQKLSSLYKKIKIEKLSNCISQLTTYTYAKMFDNTCTLICTYMRMSGLSTRYSSSEKAEPGPQP